MAAPVLSRRHGPPLLAALLLVLLVHAGLLAGLPAGVPSITERATAVQVRQIVLKAAPPAAPRPPRVAAPNRDPTTGQRAPQAANAPLAAAAPAPRDEAVHAEAPAEPADRAERAPAVQAESDPAAHAETAASPEPAASASALALVASGGVAASAAAPAPVAGELPPVYRTRLPPAATLHYELRRGMVTGEGELQWRPGPDGYELQIEGRAFGMALLGWASRGGVDAAGLAPQRFVDRRRGRDLRAANFQRDKGLVSWSTTTAELPLLAGAQDRLSWMLQIAAIAEADATQVQPGARVAMQVVGARGDADLWTFAVLAREALDLPAGRVDGALHLRREPRKPFDTVVDVWLDPARTHLPVRLRLATAGGDDAMEFRLKP